MIRGTGKRTAQTVGVHPSTVTRGLQSGKTEIVRAAQNAEGQIKVEKRLVELNKTKDTHDI